MAHRERLFQKKDSCNVFLGKGGRTRTATSLKPIIVHFLVSSHAVQQKATPLFEQGKRATAQDENLGLGKALVSGQEKLPSRFPPFSWARQTLQILQIVLTRPFPKRPIISDELEMYDWIVTKDQVHYRALGVPLPGCFIKGEIPNKNREKNHVCL